LCKYKEFEIVSNISIAFDFKIKINNLATKPISFFMADFSQTRVKLVFSLSILTTIITLIWFFIARAIDMPELSNYLGITEILFVISGLLSKYGNLTIARVI